MDRTQRSGPCKVYGGGERLQVGDESTATIGYCEEFDRAGSLCWFKHILVFSRKQLGMA